MSQTQYAKASEVVHNSVKIQPTESVPAQPMTSLMTNCDMTVRTVELDLTLKGELSKVTF